MLGAVNRIVNTVRGWKHRAGTLKSQKSSVEGALLVIRLVLSVLFSVIFLVLILLTVQFRPRSPLPDTVNSLLVVTVMPILDFSGLSYTQRLK